jgi:hypothetical protein
MSEELGKVEKPEVSSFKQKRRLLQVPTIYSSKDSPAEYVELYGKYWQQVKEQVNKLENSLGSVTVIFHENLAKGGEEGLKIMQAINTHTYEMVNPKYQAGIKLVCIEDNDTLEEVMDWEHCMLMGFISNKVANMVYGFYTDASRKRCEFIAKAINDNLRDGDVALLFIREGHMVQFPTDIDIFSVSPPALDEIKRWSRAQRENNEAA